MKKQILFAIFTALILLFTVNLSAQVDVNKGTILNFDMVYVSGGTFQMGNDDKKQMRSVTLSDFYIGKYEVTQKQWRDVMNKNSSNFSGCDNCPVEWVSWSKVQKFIRKLNQKTGKTYRLPTQAEWEFAAKGGTKSMGYTYSGSNNLADVAWYSKNSGSRTHPVGQKQSNELGLFDMSGNVWEWCSDWGRDYSSVAQMNPKGPSSGLYRVNRGGGWRSNAWYCRTSFRDLNDPDFGFIIMGFRLALEP